MWCWNPNKTPRMSTRCRVSLDNNREETRITILTKFAVSDNNTIYIFPFAEQYLLHLKSPVGAGNRKSMKAVLMENVLNGQIGVNGPNVHKRVEGE